MPIAIVPHGLLAHSTIDIASSTWAVGGRSAEHVRKVDASSLRPASLFPAERMRAHAALRFDLRESEAPPAEEPTPLAAEGEAAEPTALDVGLTPDGDAAPGPSPEHAPEPPAEAQSVQPDTDAAAE